MADRETITVRVISVISIVLFIVLALILISITYNKTAEYQESQQSFEFAVQAPYSPRPRPPWQAAQSEEEQFRKEMETSFQELNFDVQQDRRERSQEITQRQFQKSLDQFKREQQSQQLKKEFGI